MRAQAVFSPYVLTKRVCGQQQGDLEDRKKINEVDIRKEKELKAQREADDLALEPRKLAALGYTVEDIVQQLERLKMVALKTSHHLSNSSWPGRAYFCISCEHCVLFEHHELSLEIAWAKGMFRVALRG